MPNPFPETSLEAHEAVTRSGKKKSQMDLVEQMLIIYEGSVNPGLTRKELTRLIKSDVFNVDFGTRLYQVGRRLSDLKKAEKAHSLTTVRRDGEHPYVAGPDPERVAVVSQGMLGAQMRLV